MQKHVPSSSRVSVAKPAREFGHVNEVIKILNHYHYSVLLKLIVSQPVNARKYLHYMTKLSGWLCH